MDGAEAPFLLWLNALDRAGLGLGGWLFVIAWLGLSLFGSNSNELGRKFRPTPGWALATMLLFVLGVLAIEGEQTFIYFQF